MLEEATAWLVVVGTVALLYFVSSRHHGEGGGGSQRRRKRLRTAGDENERSELVMSATRDILDSSFDAVVIADGGMRIQLFNAAAQRLFGYTPDEVLGRSVDMLMPEPYRSDHSIYVERYKQTGKTKIIGLPRELQGERKDGTRFPLLLSIGRSTVHGQPLFTATVRDLSAEYEARRQLLQETEELAGHSLVASPSVEDRALKDRTALRDSYEEAVARTQAIVDAAIDAIVVADTRLVIEVFNTAAEAMFRYHSAEVIGKNVSMLMPEPYSSRHDSYVQHYKETGEVKLIGIPRELVGLRKDGTTFPLLLSLSRGNVGGKEVFSACMRDLTEKKKTDREHIELLEAQRMLGVARDELDETRHQLLHSSASSATSSGPSSGAAAMVSRVALHWSDMMDDARLHDIRVGGRLGFGHFGDVFRGRWQSRTDVALKKIKEQGDAQRFIREAEILMGLKHPHIVQFLGMYKSPEDEIYLVTEFMPLGSLDVLLSVNRFAVDDLVDMLIHAAAGMEYLHSRDVLHRDLACRNLLVSVGLTSKYVIKVSDFGLACEVYGNYYTSSSKIFPVRWTAPESLEFGRFATSSDVWSFGVTMWEVLSGGAIPYAGMENRDILPAIRSGYRLPRPAVCPDVVFAAMSSCWESEPALRASFEALLVQLESFRLSLQLIASPSSTLGVLRASSLLKRSSLIAGNPLRESQLLAVPPSMNAEYDASAAAAVANRR